MVESQSSVVVGVGLTTSDYRRWTFEAGDEKHAVEKHDEKHAEKHVEKHVDGELLWFLLELLASTNNPHFIQCNKSRF